MNHLSLFRLPLALLPVYEGEDDEEPDGAEHHRHVPERRHLEPEVARERLYAEVGEDDYTVPPDNILEYALQSSSYISPQYLEGRVCAAFAVVTPYMQQRMEADILGEGELEDVNDEDAKTIIRNAKDLLEKKARDQLIFDAAVEYISYLDVPDEESLMMAIGSYGKEGASISFGPENLNRAVVTYDHESETLAILPIWEDEPQEAAIIQLKDFTRLSKDLWAGRHRVSISYE